MTEKLKLSVTVAGKPDDVYDAWMDSKKHAAMTGSEAEIDPKVNGAFTAWDGYIEGTTVELEPKRRVVQQWRTTDFPEGSPDSLIEVIFEKSEKGTKVVLIHTEIPDGQKEEYKQGWKEFYFDPMRAYFK